MPRATLYVLDGQIINVGAWDEARCDVLEAGVPTGEVVIGNPVPAGAAILEDAEYAVTADGRFVLPSDHAALRRAEYPPIADYLDAVVKGDANAKRAYLAACRSVKAKYPKPDSTDVEETQS